MNLPLRLTAPLACLAVASACSFDDDLPVNLAVRAVAVDLAYENEDLVEPVAPETIVRTIPAPPEVTSGLVPISDFATPPPSDPPPTFDFAPQCPSAPPNRVPDEPASVNFRNRVSAGIYPRHNEGTFSVTGGVFDLTLPYPPATRDLVSEVREIQPPTPQQQVGDVLGDTEPQPEQPGSAMLEWDVRTEITNDISVTNTYRFTGTAIALVRRQTITPSDDAVFVPSPPIDLMQVNEGIGHTWRSAGVDLARGTALQVEGTIVDRKPVDLCGELVDGFVVHTNETFVDLDTGATSGTTEPNVRSIATQFGGLIIREELHYTETSRDEESGSPLQITYDFVSTLDAPRPSAPLPESEPGS